MKRVLVASVLVLVLAACRSESVEIPEHLLGTWKTAAPAYKDRFIRFQPGVISLGLGRGAVDSYPVSGLRTAVRAEVVHYIVMYRHPDGERSQLSFYFETDRKGVIRLEHQAQIAWFKEGAAR